MQKRGKNVERQGTFRIECRSESLSLLVPFQYFLIGVALGAMKCKCCISAENTGNDRVYFSVKEA